MVSKDCLFCKIVEGEVKSNFLDENDRVVAFADINPIADVHILIVPKKHIEGVSTIKNEDSGLRKKIEEKASTLNRANAQPKAR